MAFDRLLARIFHQDVDGFAFKGVYVMELRFKAALATKDIDLTCFCRINGNESSNRGNYWRGSQIIDEGGSEGLFHFLDWKITNGLGERSLWRI